MHSGAIRRLKIYYIAEQLGTKSQKPNPIMHVETTRSYSRKKCHPRTFDYLCARPGSDQILEIWEHGNPEIRNSRNTNLKFSKSKSKSVLLKLSERSGFVRKNPPCPISCHFKHFDFFFLWADKIQKRYTKHDYFPWWSNGPYSLKGLDNLFQVIWVWIVS